MTLPRKIVPGEAFEVSRRTMYRMFMLVPTLAVRELILYVLGVAAKRYSVSLYAAVVLLNHFHLLGRDNLGVLPDFMRDFDSLVARALNTYLGKEEAVWSSDGYTPLRPVSPDALERRIRYVLANPLEANLVARLVDYPHVILQPGDVGRDIVIKRPRFFFSANTDLPSEVVVRFEQPPEYAHMTEAEYRAHLRGMIETLEREHRERRESSGVSVMGARRLQKVRWHERPASEEEWFRLRPQVAARDRALRIEAIQRLVGFRAAYREAYLAYRAGAHDTVFPAGTWWMHRQLGVAVDLPPP